MKQFKYLIMSVLVTVFGAIGCSNVYDASTIEGKWIVTNMETDMPSLSPAIIKSGEELALSTTYLFKSDGTSIETSSYYPEGIYGVWTFAQDSLILRIKSTDESIPSDAEHRIEFISKRKMLWMHDASELGNFTMTLVKRM